jgi:hypothetical protein
MADRATVTEMSSHTSAFRHKARSRRLVVVTPVLAVLAGVIIAGCGSSSGGSSAGSANREGHRAPASSPYTPAGSEARAPATQAGGIPQNNGGDHDADNNGGPSDGDGNV